MTKLDSNDLHQRWQRMVRQLKAEPGVTVTVAEKNLRSSEGYVEEVAGELGIPAHSDLIAFVGWANGLQLEWTLEGSSRFGGSIHIPPLVRLTDPEKWPGPMDALDVPLESYGVSFDPAEGHVVPFDFFQHNPENIEIAAFLPRGEDLDVFVSEDDIACIEDTALVSFAEYIDLVFRTYGSPLARMALQLGYGNEDAVRASDEFPEILTKTPSLTEIVELIRSEPNSEQIRAFFR